MSESAPPYGLWKSPYSPQSLALGQRLGEALWDTDGRTLVWLEGRDDRGVLVASDLDGNGPRDLTDIHSVRARVGYSGGDFAVAHGQVYFVSKGRIYKRSLKRGAPQALTFGIGETAGMQVSPGGDFLAYVFSNERRDGIAVVDTGGRHWPRKLAEGHDFYMQPRWSRDGRRLAFIAWDHPNMPWDGTQLFLADVHTHPGELPTLHNLVVIAGGSDVAVVQPEFSPDGKYLSYLSDEGGWHNLHLYDLEGGSSRQLTNETTAQLGGPAWSQELRWYAWLGDSHSIAIIRNERGVSALRRVYVASGVLAPFENVERYTDFAQPSVAGSSLAVTVSSSVCPGRIVVRELAAPAKSELIVKRATPESIDESALISPEPIAWRNAEGVEIHGLLYSTKRADCHGLPPAIVRVHGGPTAQSKASYLPEIQFLATRGYTVLDLNYRGSTGYGRDYMKSLRGNWGLHDVADAVSAAQHLAQSELADGQRLVIMGGSAGGFTVLQTLAMHPHVFKAGVCLFGVSNQFALAMETHKFEERYTDSLIGPLPQASAAYRERSPAFFAEKIVDPLVIFQGEIDEVVPKNQSDAIADSLKARGIPHEYHVYPGEGHGWRKGETIAAYYTALEKVLKAWVVFS